MAAYNPVYLIRFIDNPSLEMQLAAVQSNYHIIRYIKNPTLEAIDLARKNGYDRDGERINTD